MAPSGGAGITSPLRRLPPPPLFHPHLSSSPSSFLSLAPLSLSGFLSSWLLFVCVVSLAGMCVACLCVSSSGCCVVGVFVLWLVFFVSRVLVSCAPLLCLCFLVPGFLVVCPVCVVSCLRGLPYVCVVGSVYLCVCCVWCLCLWLVRMCCVLTVLPCLCVLLVLCLLLIACYLLVYCLLSFCVLSVVCCRCCFR